MPVVEIRAHLRGNMLLSSLQLPDHFPSEQHWPVYPARPTHAVNNNSIQFSQLLTDSRIHSASSRYAHWRPVSLHQQNSTIHANKLSQISDDSILSWMLLCCVSVKRIATMPIPMCLSTEASPPPGALALAPGQRATHPRNRFLLLRPLIPSQAPDTPTLLHPLITDGEASLSGLENLQHPSLYHPQ